MPTHGSVQDCSRITGSLAYNVVTLTRQILQSSMFPTVRPHPLLNRSAPTAYTNRFSSPNDVGKMTGTTEQQQTTHLITTQQAYS